MSYHSDLDAALSAKLNAFATAQNIRVAWPNVPFTAGVSNFLRVNLLPAGTVPLGLDYDCTLDITGIFQIDVMIRKGTGSTQARALIDAVLSEFRYGQTATNGTLSVLCQSVSVAPFLERDEFLAYPVSVTYRGFVQNV